MTIARLPGKAYLVHALTAAAIAWFILLLFRTAWVCDDAYLTFRTIDNLLHGYGPRWNVAERVQAYTHPLWMILLAGIEFITREPYVTSIVTSVLCSIGALVLVVRQSRTNWQAIVGVLLLGSAKSFVDFSTSGLENPLSHLLIAAYVWSLAKWAPGRRPWLPLLFASLALVNRQDLLWLVGPSLVVHLVRTPAARRLPSLVLGLAPLLAWEAFSLVYYGFLAPNTAFAKLSTGIPHAELVRQGLWYLQDSWQRDPLTLAVVLASIVVALLPIGRAASWPRGLAAGQAPYLAYIVWIGGDFMSGRFLAAPLLVGVLQLIATPIEMKMRWQAALAVVVIAAGFLPATPNAMSGPQFGRGQDYQDFHGITDERLFYYPQTGLLRWRHQWTTPPLVGADVAANMLAAGQRVATRDMVGMFGFAAGPDLHIVDVLGLGDPLLARLPAQSGWRVGHYRRDVPEGYIQTLRSGTNQIVDPSLARYYDVLSIVTRSPVWSFTRLRAIVSLNLGLISPSR